MAKRKIALLISLIIAANLATACAPNGQDDNTENNSAESVVSYEQDAAASDVSADDTVSEISVPEATEAAGNSSEVSESSVKASSAQTSQSSKGSQASKSQTSKQNSKASDQKKTTVTTTSSPDSKQTSSTQKTQQQSSSQKTETSKPSSQTSSPSPQQPAQTKVDNNSVGDINLFNSLFNLANKITVQLDVPKTELDKLQNDYYTYERKNSKSPIYRKATLTVTVNGQHFKMEEVGIRLKGNMSLSPVYDERGNMNLSHYKLSFNETFDDKTYYGSEAKKWSSQEERNARKNRRFATLKKMDLKWNSCYDNTNIREIYASEMFKENGVLAQNIGLTQVIMNGTNFGVMRLYEPVDELFLEKRLPASALGGDLYKCGWTMKPCNYISNQVTYGVDDKDRGTKYNFNLKTNEKSSNHASLRNLLNVLATRNDKASFESVIDTDYLANFLAASYFAGDPDDIRNNYNNHYIYFRKDNGKAIFIPYDNDRTMGITFGYNPDGTGMTKQSPYSSIAAGARQTQANPVINYSILNGNAFLTNEYEAALKRIADSDILDVNRFNSVYELARNNYQGVVNPSVGFANQYFDFTFSLDGAYTSSDRSNISFAIFSEKILETYHKEIG